MSGAHDGHGDAPRILMVLTSHDRLGDTGTKTGYWLEEFAAPYYTFLDAGAIVSVASPKGGRPPVDPASEAADALTAFTARLQADGDAQAVLDATERLSDVVAAEFDAIFYPGGHGPMWDLTNDATSIALIESFFTTGKPVGAVCHAPAVLTRVQVNGAPLVRGRRVAGFTNEEEAAVGHTRHVPFLLENELTRLGGAYEKVADWLPYVVTDGLLVTGQNPASAEPAAKALLSLLASVQVSH